LPIPFIEKARIAFTMSFFYSSMHRSDNPSDATKDQIAVCAYFIWEQEGKPIGRALDHWLQAELQLAASLWHESLWYHETANSCRSG
jgi:Protein of unknown function (DUF2934)